MTLAAKYTKLKKQIGGNREKTHYEETFGMPMEEFYHITMPNPHIRRIMAEIEFSIRLSAEHKGKFDGNISKSLDLLENAMERDGVLTSSACAEAEALLLPLKAEAQKYELILAAHAHIDMNWMWSWHETVASTIATFQTMLNLMDEYPDFCFSQSQTSVYKIIDDYAPELKPRMLERIKEGRWEITSSAWVETDKNMPSSESLLNHIHYSKKYLRENWGINPDSLDLDFSPDTFGHSANIPEIDSFGGVKYYYHCRGLDGDNALYRWRAPSGSELLVYREQYWYNSGVTPLPAIGLIDVSKRSGGLKTGIMVYGVGDHGGGPTRRDIERAVEMQDWQIFPKIRFGTFHDYFKAAESVRSKLPVIDKEINYFAPGCYTTQSRIKMGNRHTEAALFDAQALNALASEAAGVPYSQELFRDAWQNVLFTHFHDILTGSCVQDSREHAMGLFTHAAAVADTRASFSTQGISAAINTSKIKTDALSGSQSEGAGAGYGVENFSGAPVPERGTGLTRIYTLYNTASFKRDKCCEITVWDWVGDLREISVADADGNPLEFALLDTELQHYWDHKFFRILIKAEIMPFGYATAVIRQKEPDEYRVYFQPESRNNHPYSNCVLENEFIKAEFSNRSGEMLSLTDKATGEEWLKEGESGGLRVIATEKSSSNAWQIGRYVSINDNLTAVSVKPLSGAPLRSGFTVEQTVGKSKITTDISLTNGDKTIKLAIKADWCETSQDGETVPVLAYLLPVKTPDRYRYDVPGGSVCRGGMEMDVPALQYGAAVREKRAAFISADCKYGYRGNSDGLISTLINSTHAPDPYPERGIQNIILNIGITDDNPKELEDAAFSQHHPIRYQPTSSHKGKLAPQGSLMDIKCGTAVVSGVTNEDGALCVKLFETAGKASTVTLTLRKAVKSAELTSLEGATLEKLTPTDKKVSFKIKPNSMNMLRLK